MNSSRSVMFGLIAGAFALAACGNSDTILALRVNTSDGVGLVSKVHVTVTQGSLPPVEEDFTMLPTKDIDVGQAGMTTKMPVLDSFFRRITLPESWSDGDAKIDVQAFDQAGSPYLAPQTTHTEIRDNEATSANVTLKLPPAEGGTNGGGGMGGSGGGGGAAAGGDAGGTNGGGGASAGGGAGGGGGEATAGGGTAGGGS